MNDSTRRRARLLVALLLVTSPLWAPALDVTGQDYEYESARVVTEDDGIRLVDGPRRPPSEGIEGIDCLYESRISRHCVQEAGLLNGTQRADHPSVHEVIGGPHFATENRYVAFTGDAAVYERTARWESGHYVVGLVQVSAEKAVDEIATDAEYVSPPVKTAIEEGSVRTDEPLSDANEIVKTGDGYFVVYETGRESLLDADPGQERALEWAAVLFGALLLRRTD